MLPPCSDAPTLQDEAASKKDTSLTKKGSPDKRVSAIPVEKI